MPERPLLILPTPTEPAKRSKKTGGGGRPHLPSRDRQAERLTPRFTVLQETLDAMRARLLTESSGVISQKGFIQASPFRRYFPEKSSAEAPELIR